MILSIIIPVYNVEAYVEETLESVFSTNATDFEVIVINDGTTDNSMDVVRKFDNRPNLVIIEQENQGLSAARMAGLSVAHGEYVFFVDSDDYLFNNSVDSILDLIRGKTGIDVFVFPLYRTYLDESQNRVDLSYKEEQCLSGHDYLKNLGTPTPTPRFILKRSLTENHWLFFPTGLLHEDIYWGIVLLYQAKRVKIMTQPMYVYRQRPGSIMNEVSIRSSYDLVKSHQLLMDFLVDAVAPEDVGWLRPYCFRYLKWSYTLNSRLYGTKDFRHFIRSNGLYVWREWNRAHPDGHFTRIIRRLVFCLMPQFYMKQLGTS